MVSASRFFYSDGSFIIEHFLLLGCIKAYCRYIGLDTEK